MSANYNRLRLMGSCVLGTLFAVVPTLMFYKASQKPNALLIFIPLAVVFTRLVLWGLHRASTEYADSVRRRHRSNDLPLGGREVGRVSPGEVRHKRGTKSQ